MPISFHIIDVMSQQINPSPSPAILCHIFWTCPVPPEQ